MTFAVEVEARTGFAILPTHWGEFDHR